MTVTEELLRDEGYWPVRQLPSGVWVGVQQNMYTTGLYVGLDEVGYRCRYCYENTAAAIEDLIRWDGNGDPPGKWIKHKGSGVDRLNPRLAEEDF